MKLFKKNLFVFSFLITTNVFCIDGLDFDYENIPDKEFVHEIFYVFLEMVKTAPKRNGDIFSFEAIKDIMYAKTKKGRQAFLDTTKIVWDCFDVGKLYVDEDSVELVNSALFMTAAYFVHKDERGREEFVKSCEALHEKYLNFVPKKFDESLQESINEEISGRLSRFKNSVNDFFKLCWNNKLKTTGGVLGALVILWAAGVMFTSFTK